MSMMLNRKERERIARVQKLRSLGDGLYTLFLHICFFAFLLSFILAFIYFL